MFPAGSKLVVVTSTLTIVQYSLQETVWYKSAINLHWLSVQLRKPAHWLLSLHCSSLAPTPTVISQFPAAVGSQASLPPGEIKARSMAGQSWPGITLAGSLRLLVNSI